MCAVHGTNPVGCKSRYQAYVEPKVSQRASASSRGGVPFSYLSQSGYTLTVVLNFSDGSTVAITSNEKDWLPAYGSFEVMP